MEDQMKEKNNEKKKIIVILAVIIILSAIFLLYNQIFSASSQGNTILSMSECETQMNQWCTECFSINPRIDVWNIAGNRVGETLAKCSNDYFQTNWMPEQDCTGNAVSYCQEFIKE